MFTWLEILGFEKIVMSLRKTFGIFEPSEFVIYSLPNGLWILSITILLLIIWKDYYKTNFKFYFTCLFLLVILPETLQFFKIISGTFDLVDLSVNLIFFCLPFVFIIGNRWIKSFL